MPDSYKVKLVRIWVPLGAFIVLAVFLFSLAGDFGMSWDEQRRWRSGDQKLDYYQELLDSDNKWETMQNSPNDVYPGLYDVPVALLRRHTDFDAVALSRFVNLAFGLFSVVGCFLLARLYFEDSSSSGGNWPAATWGPILSVALLLTMPEFFGHLFINPKDIPFAATYVLGLWAIARVVRSAPDFRMRNTVIAGLVVGMCMSARPPGVVLLGYAFIVGLLAVYHSSRDRSDLKRTLGHLFLHGGVMVVASLAVLFVFWPASHRNPFTSSVEAVERLRTFSETIPVLFGGQMYSAGETPFHYVVWMFLIKASLPVLLLSVLGLVLLVARLRSTGKVRLQIHFSAPIRVLTWLAVLFPVAYVLVRQPAIHNGFRHMLYILPPLAILLASVWHKLMTLVESATARRLCQGALGVALILAASVLVRLHPYQYIYYNSLVGGTAGSLNRYETEYWFTSGKEALELLRASPEYQELRRLGEVPVMIAGPLDTVEFHIPDGMRIEQDRNRAKFYIGNTQMRTDLLVEGTELFRIQRMGLPIVVVKKL